MIDAFFQGIVVLGTHALDVFILLLSGLSTGAIPALFLVKHDQGDDRIVYILLLGFGLLGLVSPALSLVGLLHKTVIIFTIGIGILALVVLVKRGAFSRWRKSDYQKNVWVPSLIFFIFFIIRLGFLQDLVLPPFSDSARHYEKLGRLLSLEHNPSLTFDAFFPYYHWGFHGITAWVDRVTSNFSPMSLALFAQFFLGMLPVAIYFMLLSYTDGDLSVAIFGALLAGLGWVMPAYAVSFGKYPALTAICLLPVLLGLFHESIKNNSKQWGWWAYIAVISLALIWIHSRIAIVLVFFYITYSLSHFFQKNLSQRAFERGTLFVTFLIIFLVLVLHKGSQARLSFNYYLDVSDNATLLVIALLPFAFRKYTLWTGQWALMIVLLILATNAPLPLWFYHYQLTLLDQQFFDLVFFIPLTVLGAFAIGGVKEFILPKGQFYKDVFMFFLFFVVVNGALIQPWKPLSTSNYVAQDDVRALNWIEKNTKPTSIFMIAAVEKNENYARPSDAGVWIYSLTGRNTIKIPFQFQWDSSEAVRRLCTENKALSPTYIYVGHMESSYDIPSCNQSLGLTPVLCYPQAKIFELDCTPFFE